MKLIINKKILIYSTFAGGILIIAGIVLGFKVFPMIVANQIWEKVILKNNSEQWEVFKRIPFPLQVKIYFFNIENVDDILQGAKPAVKEVGPYIYKLNRWKGDIEWDGDEISYHDYMRFEFDKNESGILSDEDEVTILNSAYNALLLTVEELSPGALETVNDALPDIFNKFNGLFMRAKVKDLLFDGTIICGKESQNAFASKMICNQFKEKSKMSKAMKIVDNSIRYSYLEFKNNSHMGRLTVKSGIFKKEEISNLVRYNNEKQVFTWNGNNSVCNQINSTTSFRPYLTPEMEFYVFTEDFCRRLKMVYQKNEIVQEIQGFKYIAANDSFTSQFGTENECYCVNGSRTLSGEKGCLKNGLLDMSTCLGAPMLVSFPHLLYGSKEYLNSVEGFHPDPNLHDTFVVLEPLMGAPLKVAKRVQFNMFIRPIEDITSLENVTKALIPILWIEESVILDDGHINLIKHTLYGGLKILEIIKWSIIAVGAVTIIASVFLMIYSNN